MILLLTFGIFMQVQAARTAYCPKLTVPRALSNNMQCSDFVAQKHIQVQLPKANFRGGDLTHSDWHQSQFHQAIFSYTVMDRMSAQKIDFTESLLMAAKGHAAHFDYSDFSKANLSESNFQGSRFAGAKFVQSNLQKADLRYSDLRFANFTNADLRGANLEKTIWQGAIFSGALIDGNTKLPFDQERSKDFGIVRK